MAATQTPKQNSHRQLDRWSSTELDRWSSTDVGAIAPRIGDVPSIIVRAGARTSKRFTTYFTDELRNRHTREAYFRAAFQFMTWCEGHGLTLELIESYHVSAYVEQLLSSGKSRPTVKQHLAAIRKLYDWLVVGQIVSHNPAHAVRGPKHVVREGLTPILDAEQMKQLLDSIDVTSVVGLRDRALISVMAATFSRVEAAVGMNISDYFQDGKHWSVRLREKNSKVIKMPVQHKLEEHLDAYIDAVGGAEAFPFETVTDPRERSKTKQTKKRPLFLSTRGRSGQLTDRRMTRQDAWRMVRRRAKQAGIKGNIGNHSFRGTGITNYLENGGNLSEAQRMAGHADPRTTRLYDRRGEKITRGEVEKITILG